MQKRLGDLLIRSKHVTADQLSRALTLQTTRGGRLGDHLVAMGALNQATLDAFLHRMPTEPADLAATGLESNELVTLLLKLMYQGQLESVRQVVDAIKLPSHIVLELLKLAVDRKMTYARGLRNTDSRMDMAYSLTEEGRIYAVDALQRSRYAGPAPVSLDEFTEQVNAQKLTNERVTFERLSDALKGLDFPEQFVEQCGPAVNSGRAILLYGPPGNGKTSVALRLASVFNDVIYVPYAVTVDAQIIGVFDPSIHIPITSPAAHTDNGSTLMRAEEFDSRWIPCRRPFVVAGGELTLEMLDLRYDPTSHFYEAPLHMKALGGCFVIDDFGRQMVSPTELLNRWIVPLGSRIDYLKLHTGKSFSIPFDELVIFSTNLEPEDLMDAAFLRRLAYKIEIGRPTLELYKSIFLKECESHGMTLTEAVFQEVVNKITSEKGIPLASFQPGFVVDQVVGSCRFAGQAPHFEPRYIDFAVDNLHVRRSSPFNHRVPQQT